MPLEHLLYIPCTLLVGLIAGYVLGTRAVRREHEALRRRAKR